MANQLKLSLVLQNLYQANDQRRPVKHGLPELNLSLSGKDSVVLELTGTGVHTLVNDATNFNYNAGTILKDPDGASVEITDNQVIGFALYVDRAVAATAPTGHVRVTNAGFCGWMSDGYWKMYEDAVFLFLDNATPVTSDGLGLTIDLSNSTGMRVSLIALCK